MSLYNTASCSEQLRLLTFKIQIWKSQSIHKYWDKIWVSRHRYLHLLPCWWPAPHCPHSSDKCSASHCTPAPGRITYRGAGRPRNTGMQTAAFYYLLIGKPKNYVNLDVDILELSSLKKNWKYSNNWIHGLERNLRVGSSNKCASLSSTSSNEVKWSEVSLDSALVWHWPLVLLSTRHISTGHCMPCCRSPLRPAEYRQHSTAALSSLLFVTLRASQRLVSGGHYRSVIWIPILKSKNLYGQVSLTHVKVIVCMHCQ